MSITPLAQIDPSFLSMEVQSSAAKKPVISNTILPYIAMFMKL